MVIDHVRRFNHEGLLQLQTFAADKDLRGVKTSYSGTSAIRAVWDQGVPVTLKLPVTLNLFMNYVQKHWSQLHKA